MKVFIPARFSEDSDNKSHVDMLCKAVKQAHMEPFCFVRDVQHYKDTLGDEKKLWQRIYDELGACDALMIDVTNDPSSGQLVEVGIAFALRKPVIVVKKRGAKHKPVIQGVSSTVIEYEDVEDLAKQLDAYDTMRNYNTTDRITLLIMHLLVAGLIGWMLSQVFLPLGLVGAVGYWLVIHHFFKSVRIFDRIVIFIPLAGIWWIIFALLYPSSMLLGFSWTIAYWLVVLFLLRRFKFSL